jgi:D-alanyl-D-alanine-carboxypeptidase/D-alanyl-D-alanine-endopeptidase
MSKAFTALAILKLRDEGKLSLDALAETYVPEMRGWRYPTADSPRIRVRDLLSHTGGFVTDDPWGDRQQVMSEAEFTRMLAEACRSPARPAPRSNIRTSAMRCSAASSPTSRACPTSQLYRARDHAPARHGLDRLRGDATGRRSAARSAIAGRMSAGARSRPCATACSARWAASRPAPTIMPSWIAFLLSAWPARDGPETGPVARHGARAGAGPELPRLRQRFPASSAGRLPAGRGLRHGLHRGQDCELGNTSEPRRRLSGLRLAHDAAARSRHRHLRLHQPHLCRLRRRLGRGGGAAQGGR